MLTPVKENEAEKNQYRDNSKKPYFLDVCCYAKIHLIPTILKK